MVKKCSGKVKRGPRAAEVIKCNGIVVSDPAVKASLLEDHFFQEFGHRGDFMEPSEWCEEVEWYEKDNTTSA